MTPTIWDLFLSMPTICDVDNPDLTAVMQDFAGMLEVACVLDELPLDTDQRAYVALLGMAFVVWDEPAAELRPVARTHPNVAIAKMRIRRLCPNPHTASGRSLFDPVR